MACGVLASSSILIGLLTQTFQPGRGLLAGGLVASDGATLLTLLVPFLIFHGHVPRATLRHAVLGGVAFWLVARALWVGIALAATDFTWSHEWYGLKGVLSLPLVFLQIVIYSQPLIPMAMALLGAFLGQRVGHPIPAWVGWTMVATSVGVLLLGLLAQNTSWMSTRPLGLDVILLGSPLFLCGFWILLYHWRKRPNEPAPTAEPA